MKILFMGTGAADWDISNRQPGEFFRRLTSVMINDDLIIDFNAETTDYLEMDKCDVSRVENILITHTHSDHYVPSVINEVFGNGVEVWLESPEDEKSSSLKAVRRKIFVGDEFKVGNYTVTAIEANHSVEDTSERPVNYIISDGEKTMLWACDGAWFLNKSWHEIRKHRFDLVVFDGTLGDEAGDYRIFEHNNLTMVKEMAATFKKLDLMKDGAKMMISHMSRFSQYPHDKLVEELEPVGVSVAFDGLMLDI